VNTVVARHVQIHRALMAQNLAPQNPAFQQTLRSTEGLMSQYSGPGLARMQAYGLIQGTVDQQAAAFAYVDVFRYLAVACFFCGAIVLLMKRVKARKGAAAMAH
jgi:MFS transporter, DHA2 family, multidrug resistance protein